MVLDGGFWNNFAVFLFENQVLPMKHLRCIMIVDLSTNNAILIPEFCYLPVAPQQQSLGSLVKQHRWLSSLLTFD